MVFLQFMLTSSAQYTGGAYSNNPNLISVPLYGKYRTRIISIQYFGSVNTVVQLQSRQFAMSMTGSDSTGGSVASRFPYLLIGTTNASNPPIIGTFPWEFVVDWDGRFEYVLLDTATNKPLAIAPGTMNFVINLDIEPVETNIGQPFNPSLTDMSHTFSQLPKRT